MVDHLTDAPVSPERLDELTTMAVLECDKGVLELTGDEMGEIAAALRELKALRAERDQYILANAQLAERIGLLEEAFSKEPERSIIEAALQRLSLGR